MFFTNKILNLTQKDVFGAVLVSDPRVRYDISTPKDESQCVRCNGLVLDLLYLFLSEGTWD